MSNFATRGQASPEHRATLLYSIRVTVIFLSIKNHQDLAPLSLSEGWVETDVGFIVKKWVNQRWLNHTIQIACNSCSDNRDIVPISVELTLKPFLVIHTAPLPQRNRPKRNSNCQPEMKECCRDELYINFEDIGWSDWILHPSGYHAYFCRGSCSSAASLTVSGSAYNNVIRVSTTRLSAFSWRRFAKIYWT